MQANGLSRTGAFRKLRHIWELGEESRTAWLPYLIDKPIPEDLEEALAAVVGWPPEAEPEPEPVATPAPDLAAALMALAKSNQAMADELGALRQERASLSGRLAELEATVRLLVQQVPGGLGTSAPPALDSHGQ